MIDGRDESGLWNDKRVVVLGLARQGTALVRHLAAGGAQVVVSDLKTADQLGKVMQELSGLDIQFELGGHPPELLEGADLLCLSGGVPADLPLVQQARHREIPISNDSQIFLESVPAQVVGITGSAGKSTTTDLVGRMAEMDTDQSVWVGGNIGRPLLADLSRMAPNDVVVMELSSFQLELMTRSTEIAAILNLTPNHLDRHYSMQAYRAAKARILDFQSADDVAILGRDDPGAWELRERVQGSLLSFGKDTPAPDQEGTFIRADQIYCRGEGAEQALLPLDLIELRGDHNLMNVLAAAAIASAMRLEPEAIAQGVEGYRGLPHRLELVRIVNGVSWFNDSIATSPERAMAALRSFDQPLILLAGGRDKGLPWDALARLASERVDHLILFGEAAGLIGQAMSAYADRARPLTTKLVSDLEAGVDAAARIAGEGEVVLLAPGGTSFDAYIDFELRGEHFRALVNEL
jgi:UDP-N-acetylmuramoylalanine--D-glutamate ligase